MPCHPSAALRRRCGALAVAVSLALFVVRPALATVVFSFYAFIDSPTGVTLLWATTSEVDVAGFDVLVKPDPAPESAYQAVGFVPALGGPDTEALYSFPITTLEIGVTYCIRLAERTTNATPGEVVDRCGYAVDPTIPTPVVVGLIPFPGTPPSPGDPALQPTPTPNTKPVPVPEPLTVLLFGAGLAGIGALVRRRGRR